MDATHIHLLLTHFPIVGTIYGIIILIYGLYSKNESIIKVSLGTFVAMALLTIPVFLTGEGAAETVENISGVLENTIEEHEELAEKAIWLMGLLGVLSLINLYVIFKKAPFSKTITVLTLLVSLATFGLFAQVGNLGGQIRHSEIRNTNATIQGENNNASETRANDGDDD
ncbi:hypothetical protein V8G69_01355 [Gaetbulibacter sp. M235]|uniref:hypothetical protein n=1 Tax=Gaetbulibacter sp. M235 TaxID=3126510 RepID=UPI00374E3040